MASKNQHFSVVSFQRSALGGYTSVCFDGVEVALIGRGHSLTVLEMADPVVAASPIAELDGRKFPSLDDAQQAIRMAYDLGDEAYAPTIPDLGTEETLPGE